MKKIFAILSLIVAAFAVGQSARAASVLPDGASPESSGSPANKFEGKPVAFENKLRAGVNATSESPVAPKAAKSSVTSVSRINEDDSSWGEFKRVGGSNDMAVYTASSFGIVYGECAVYMAESTIEGDRRVKYQLGDYGCPELNPDESSWTYFVGGYNATVIVDMDANRAIFLPMTTSYTLGPDMVYLTDVYTYRSQINNTLWPGNTDEELYDLSSEYDPEHGLIRILLMYYTESIPMQYREEQILLPGYEDFSEWLTYTRTVFVEQMTSTWEADSYEGDNALGSVIPSSTTPIMVHVGDYDPMVSPAYTGYEPFFSGTVPATIIDRSATIDPRQTEELQTYIDNRIAAGAKAWLEVYPYGDPNDDGSYTFSIGQKYGKMMKNISDEYQLFIAVSADRIGPYEQATPDGKVSLSFSNVARATFEVTDSLPEKAFRNQECYSYVTLDLKKAFAGRRMNIFAYLVNRKDGSVENVAITRMAPPLDIPTVEGVSYSYPVGSSVKIIPDFGTVNVPEYTFESGTPENVAVAADGTVTFLAAGEGAACYRSGDITKLYWFPIHSVEASGLEVFPTELRGGAGSKACAHAVFSPDNTTNQDVVWSSTNTSVATVDADGCVSIVGAGNAEIVAKAQGFSAACTVVGGNYTGISATGEGIVINIVSGGIDVCGLPQYERIIVSSMDGSVVNAALATENVTHIDLAPGIYMVKAGSVAAKVLVN